MTPPCVSCGDPGGTIKVGRSHPERVHGLCLRCDRRVRSRARKWGISVAEAREQDGPPPAEPYPAPLPGCRPYVHPEQPAPVPVLWATSGFREFWEGTDD